MKFRITISAALAAPVLLLAYSTGPPPDVTGVPVDNGIACGICHNSFGRANSDTTGSLKVETVNYRPGVRQTIRVSVMHPQASRWGFQLTARPTSDQTKAAGTFSTSSQIQVRCVSATDENGFAAPCPDQHPEFAEHVLAPRTTVGAGFTFEVVWTPPSTNVGPVIFYAAGNAANGDGTNQGDRIYITNITIQPEPSCALTERPVIAAVVNAASFGPNLASAGLISVLGANYELGAATRSVAPGNIVDGAFPKRLGCTVLEIGGVAATVLYVQKDQINAQAPTAGTAPVDIVVVVNPGEANELRSAPVKVTLQATAPGLFAFGGHMAAALFRGTSTLVGDPASVPGAKPANPGDEVSLYATGLGPTSPATEPGQIAPGAVSIISSLSVSIGGIALQKDDIFYAGLAPTLISGLYQLDLRIPAAVGIGDAPVIVTADGRPSSEGVTLRIGR